MGPGRQCCDGHKVAVFPWDVGVVGVFSDLQSCTAQGVIRAIIFAVETDSQRKGNRIMPDIKYEIVKKIGVLSKAGSGWAKDLNMISWNDREPKYDLRDWSADGTKMGKGVTLSKEELRALKELLNTMEL
jgi:hypothetical protein